MMSISLAAARAIAAALTPKHGGQIVAQLTTIPTKSEAQWVYSWANGDIIELCSHGLTSRVSATRAASWSI